MKRALPWATAVLAAGTMLMPCAAHANLMDKIAPYLPVPVDTIEMARFTIAHSAQSGEIFQHAAEQDYPYFAIIGGIKVARKNGLTESQCLLPMTVVDKAFGAAESTVSSAAAKGKTDPVIKSGLAYAGQYAKAASDSAKKKIKDEMQENIPYLKELTTMCSFAFHTDFKTFDDYYELAGNVAGNVVKVYFELKDGEYIDAIADLATLGIKASTACKLIDDAVAGGLASRTPVLGDLVIGACNGFVGVVLDGVRHVVKGGIGVAKDFANFAADAGPGVGAGFAGMGCDVFGIGCGNKVSYPEFVRQVGLGYCPSHNWGEMTEYAISTKSPKPGDFPAASFTCANNTTCVMPPFPQVSCASQADKAAVGTFFRKLADKRFADQLNQWSFVFSLKYGPNCPDDECRGLTNLARLFAENAAKKQHMSTPMTGFYTIASVTLDQAAKSGERIMNESRFRVGPAKWAQAFDSLYPEQCSTNQKCRAALNFVRTGTLLKLKQIHDSNPQTPYFLGTIDVFAVAKKQADSIVATAKSQP